MNKSNQCSVFSGQLVAVFFSQQFQISQKADLKITNLYIRTHLL
jgi:hypothetical protein